MIKKSSETGYNYATIKVTQSRIDKGLLAIPVALNKWFPNNNKKVKILLDDSINPVNKNYTSYLSKSHECRIGGLADWYRINNLKDGDEIVIQAIDINNHLYRLLPENEYISKSKELQSKFAFSKNENDAKRILIKMAQLNNLTFEEAKYNEFRRLSNDMPKEARAKHIKKEAMFNTNVPHSIKLLIGIIYHGQCQVCDFSFLKKDMSPYYEIHHLNGFLGNHLKNLLLVCGNCHNQFTYAKVEEKYRDEWLVNVKFNGKPYNVNQVMFSYKFNEPIKNIFI